MRIEFTPAIYIAYVILLFIVALQYINTTPGFALFIAAVNSTYFLLVIYSKDNHD